MLKAKQTSLGTAVFEADHYMWHIFVISGEEMEVINHSRSFLDLGLAKAYFDSLT